MDEIDQEAIGRTVDALLRPRTPFPTSGILRVADLGGMSDAARDAGLEVVYAHPAGEEILNISDQSRVPAFDLLAADLGDNPDDVFAFALRFLRVRRPVAFLLVDEANGGNIGAEFLGTIEAQTQRLGYRIYGQDAFVVGALWSEPFMRPDEATSQAVLEKMAKLVLANIKD